MESNVEMNRMNHRESGRTSPVGGSGRGHSGIRIEDVSIEEIFQRANIQLSLLDLQSEDRGKVKSALNTLSSITRFTDRKDALYVLVGYYRTEAKTVEQIAEFFHNTQSALSVDLTLMILEDLTKSKEMSRRRIFADEFLQHLSLVSRRTGHNRRNEIRTLVESSAWGDKLKRKYIDTLFCRQSSGPKTGEA